VPSNRHQSAGLDWLDMRPAAVRYFCHCPTALYAARFDCLT